MVVEDLNTKGMTRSAKGTVEAPGTNVKAKSGLNRAILASVRGGLERKLAYKAVFACGACEFRANADHNGAINILARAGLPSRAGFGPRDRGICTARGDPSGSSRAREQGMPTA